MTPHSKKIAELVDADPDLRTRSFRRNMRSLCSDTDDDTYLPWEELDDAFRFIPDSHKVVGREIHCYEVVDTSRITQQKQDLYGYAFNALDVWDVTLRLWVCDLYGNKAEQNLEMWFLDLARRSRPYVPDA